MSGAPESPDYKGAAEAQGRSSVEAINAQTVANRPNMNTPWGSMSWENKGGNWTGNLNLSPSEQASFDAQQRIKMGRSGVAETLQGQAADAMRTPMDWGALGTQPNAETTRGEAIDATMRNMRRTMDPMWDQREQETRTRLANEGWDPNSAGATKAMDTFSRSRNSAYQGAEDSAIQSGASAAQQMWGMGMGTRQQKLSEMMSRRMQPFNEMQAALNGQQVSQPNMPSFNTAGAAQATNYLDAAKSQGNYDMEAAKMNNQMMGDIMGGASKLGSSAMMFSDERLKCSIVRTGVDVIPGVPLAVWRWKGTGRADSGVIAQDLEKVRPDLVHMVKGFRVVDYAGLRGDL
jgi:hypothetical protein